MGKFTLLLISFLTIFLFNPLRSTAQNTFSSGKLSVFYPAAYDPAQHSSSLIIQNEPLVNAGLPADWQLMPSFYTNSSNKKAALVYCGKNIDFYGTGEVTGTLRRNNTSITLWNTDNYAYGTDNGKRLYQSHPWVMGVRADGSAFGVIADNTWQMYIDISDSSVVFTSEGPAFRLLIFEEASPQLCIQKLAALTGKISLPPIWSLGYQQCRYSYMTDAEVKGIADSFRMRSLPCDVIWMDIDYMDQYKVFTFSPSGFPDPAALNSYLHNKKFKSIWMIDPGVKQLEGYNIYDQGTSGDHWVKNNNNNSFVGTVWPGNCVFPDFTRPETRSWWASLYNNFMATGADGIWNDMNEPSVFNGTGGTMPVTNLHRGGGSLVAGTHLRYHNVYGRLMVQASREGILQANPAKRPFVLSRSNFLGGQQYAATWTGDNQATAAHMYLSVPMSLTLGLSGQPISGPDVTGYSGTPSSSLVAQWMALGAFYPFYRNHSEKSSIRREPWKFNASVEQACRTALQRRYRLLPYIYTLSQEASVNGMPLMRPLFFEDAADARLRNQQQVFLLGSILMVVPKWATGIHYPKGLWSSISLVGENSRTDIYQPDVRIKSGSILPLGQVIQSTADYSADSLSLIICLDKHEKATGHLYNDAGDGFGYQSGEYLMRDFDIRPLGADSLVVTVTADSGSLSAANSNYRIGVIDSAGIAYTNWTSNPVIKIPKSITGRSPFSMTPQNIPGKIEAENYDHGGQGIAYYDTDSTNNGGAYRTRSAVDIEANAEGYNVGWAVAGEWIKYTVNVISPGIYTLEARVGSGNTGNSFHVEMDGIDISGPIIVPNTGSWSTYQTVSVTTPLLTAGLKTMLIVMDSSDYNINYLNFKLSSAITCEMESISIGADIKGDSYQWQVNTGGGFTDITGGPPFTGTNSPVLTISNTLPELNNYQFRCAVTNAAVTAYSEPSSLLVASTWTGAISTAWETAANWSCNKVPDSNANVILIKGSLNYPVISSDAVCKSLKVYNNASIKVTANHTINIKGE